MQGIYNTHTHTHTQGHVYELVSLSLVRIVLHNCVQSMLKCFYLIIVRKEIS